MLWDSWLNVWRGRSLPKRRRVASGSSLKRAADVAGAWSKQRIESLEDRRLLSAGDLDPTFSEDGILTTQIGQDASDANDVAIDASGKIIVVGKAYNSGIGYVFGVARYNADGSLDSSFSADGLVTTHIGTAGDSASAVAIDGNGKIVVAGTKNDIGNSDFAVVRYNTDGSLDTSFGIAGIVTTDFSASADRAASILIDGNGKIIVVGSTTDGLGSAFAVARYNADGSLDTSFGNGGKQATKFNIAPTADATSVVLDPSGKIVVVGNATNRSHSHFAAARYNPDGTLDSSFGFGGKVTTSFGGTTEFATSAAIDTEGRLVIAGHRDDYNPDFAIARFQTNGALDTTFGVGGKLDFCHHVASVSVRVSWRF